MTENNQATAVAEDPAKVVDGIIKKDSWTSDDYNELLCQLYAMGDAADKFRTIVNDMETANPNPAGAAAIKIGVSRLLCSRFDDALKALNAATENAEKYYFLGIYYQALSKYADAAKVFAKAIQKGKDTQEVQMLCAESMALSGDMSAAKSTAKKIDSASADGLYIKGLIAELEGFSQEAFDAYDDAVEMDHSRAMFRLAYFLDLRGNDEEAMDLYQACLSCPPVYCNTLLNLAILYEDQGKYDDAIRLLNDLLMNNPSHPRAKLYMRDVCASKDMFYDEDKARRIAKRNAVLDIPVTDFELSVRARNCLKKMNIITLGDLVRTSEAELLGYKNFGETSLREIKEMLTAKGLRLGQALEEAQEYNTAGTYTSFSMGDGYVGTAVEGDDSVLSRTIESIEFSVRSRRVLEQLGIRTLGELAARSEIELMSQKNFGQTSLNEMKQKLTEFGLEFRKV
ncbi:MAG TPA: DNA-directed RNA polymerase subunit alpha C-terminal domain-containing protein [Phycisphaerae bacterium]|nr:DNA-directed RNA polymerase subunit alpha C-terminal domain-containing protein [Phycisphaerae bacterium]